MTNHFSPGFSFGINRYALVAAGLMALVAPVVQGQEASAPASAETAAYVPTMTFDVATVRESKPTPPFNVGGSFQPFNSSHVHFQNVSLMNLMQWSYGIDELRIEWPKDLPPDMLQAKFNVEAKADAETDERMAKLSADDIELEHRHMLQTMLAERFNLKAHWQTRDAKTYDLVVVKPGRLKESTGAAPSEEDLKFWNGKPVPALYDKGNATGGIEHIAHAASMTEIVKELAFWFRHPITDKTGLTGKYDFDVKSYQVYTNDRKDDETNPWQTLAQAIQEQIGLKIVPTHGPVPMLVVEHVESPSEN
jgi:uncharacterized protein (TIGR03435 family)